MIAGALEIQLMAGVARLQKDMNDAKGIVSGSAKAMESSVAAVKNLLGTLGVGLSVGMIVNKFQEVAMQTDKLRGNLVTMTGSTEAAGMAFDSLTKFAAKTPFTLDQSVQAFIKLKALGLDPSERALMSYGNTAAAMGKDMMQMIEAVADASTGEFERLKEFGIKAKQEGDNVTLTFQGVSTTIAKESTAIQEYLLKIGENKFGDAMANQMERLPGLASNLEDAVDGLFRTMADAGGTSIFGAGLKTATAAVTGLTNNLDVVGEAAKVLAAIITTRLVVSLGASSAGFIANTAQSIAYQASLARMAGVSSTAAFATSSLAAAKTGLSSAMMLVGGPAGATLLVIAGLTALITNMETAAERTDRLRGSLRLLQAEQLQQAIQHMQIEADSARATIARMEATSKGYAAQERAIEIQRDRLEETEETLRQYRAQMEGVTNGTIKLGDVTGDTTDDIKAANVVTQIAAARNAEAASKIRDLITELAIEQSQLTMTAREQAVFNAMLKAGADATTEEREQIMAATLALFDHAAALKAGEEAAKVAADAQKDLAKEAEAAATKIAEESARAAKQSAEEWMRFRDAFSDSLADMMMNGGNVFDNLGKSFERMLYKMAGDLIASGILNFLTGSSGGFSFAGSLASSGTTGKIISAGISKFAPGLASSLGLGGAAAAGTAVAGTAAAGSLTASGYVGLMGSTMAGGTAAAGAGGAAAAGGGALAGVGSAVMTAIPWVAAAVALYAAFAEKATPTESAGLLLSDLPGVASDRKMDIPAFASGIDPVLFQRRSSFDEAMKVADVFRGADQSVMDLFGAAGLGFQVSGAGISGYSETGQGAGQFYGNSAEDDLKGVGLEDQVTRYVRELIGKGAEFGKISQDQFNTISQAGSAAEMIEALKQALQPMTESAQETSRAQTESNTKLSDALNTLVSELRTSSRTNAEYAEVMDVVAAAFVQGTNNLNRSTGSEVNG